MAVSTEEKAVIMMTSASGSISLMRSSNSMPSSLPSAMSLMVSAGDSAANTSSACSPLLEVNTRYPALLNSSARMVRIRSSSSALTTLNEKGKLRTKSTCNRYLASLSHVLSVCTKQWEWLSENPVKKISREKEPRERTRFLNPDERTRLLDACLESENPLLYPFVVLLLSTGCRYSEIRKLKWTDIDLFKGRITIRESKNGDIRSVPICGLGLNLLKKLSREANAIGYVFTYNNQNQPMDPRRSIKTAIKRAGLKNFRPHDCRHSYASELLAQGLSLGEIGHLLGHKSVSMTRRYAHLIESRSIDAVSKMSEKIFKEVTNE